MNTAAKPVTPITLAVESVDGLTAEVTVEPPSHNDAGVTLGVVFDVAGLRIATRATLTREQADELGVRLIRGGRS